METHLQNELVRWEHEDVVLEPYTNYRLKIETFIEAKGEGELSDYTPPKFKQTEFAYFRTGGPPGLTDYGDGLDDLGLYVTKPSQRPCQPRGRTSLTAPGLPSL